MSSICVLLNILNTVGSKSRIGGRSIGGVPAKTSEYILFLNSAGRDKKGKPPLVFGGVSPPSSEGYVEGYAEEADVIAVLLTTCGTTIPVRTALLVMVSLGNRGLGSSAVKVLKTDRPARRVYDTVRARG